MTTGYRLATTNDMMADVLMVGHQANVEYYDPQTETVKRAQEWIMPASTFTHSCGHVVFYPDDAQEMIEDIERNIASGDGYYATIWDYIADCLRQRCGDCQERRLDALTEQLSYMDTPGPRE